MINLLKLKHNLFSANHVKAHIQDVNRLLHLKFVQDNILKPNKIELKNRTQLLEKDGHLCQKVTWIL